MLNCFRNLAADLLTNTGFTGPPASSIFTGQSGGPGYFYYTGCFWSPGVRPRESSSRMLPGQFRFRCRCSSQTCDEQLFGARSTLVVPSEVVFTNTGSSVFTGQSGGPGYSYYTGCFWSPGVQPRESSSRMLPGQFPNALCVLVLDAAASPLNFHDIFFEDLNATPEWRARRVVPGNVTSLWRRWSTALFATMRKHQFEMEGLRRTCQQQADKAYSNGRSGACPHCDDFVVGALHHCVEWISGGVFGPPAW